MGNDEWKITLDIDGVKRKVVNVTVKCMQQFLEKIVYEAKADAPVRGSHRSFWTPEEAAKATPGISGGTLRDSIDFDMDRTRLIARVFTQAGYGGYVEVGTQTMEARPFIKPAFDKATSDFLADLEGAL